MTPYFTEMYGNPSSMHSFGGQVGGAIEEARAKVARLINASAGEIIFTSCGTESDSTAIKAALAANPDKRHIVTSRVEHPAIKNLRPTEPPIMVMGPRGEPSPSTMTALPPNHAACWQLLAKAHRPETRYPPSTRFASVVDRPRRYSSTRPRPWS